MHTHMQPSDTIHNFSILFQDNVSAEVSFHMARPATVLSNSSAITNSSPPVNNNPSSGHHHPAPSVDSSSSGVVVKTKLSSEATNTGTMMNMEWTSLVDTATKAITNNDEDGNPGANTATADLNDESNSSSHVAAAVPEQKHTRNINVNGVDNETTALRDRVAALEEQLRAECQGRLELETEIEHLKEENVRLKEESQTAAQQLRRFTEWFFQTIDKS